MSLTQFIKANRSMIDAFILRKVPNIGTINDAERRLWVLNDEFLYNTARAEGVRI